MQFQLAYSYFVKKKLNEAKGIFAKMKDRQNSDYYYPANYYYGFIALTQGKYPLALKSFQKVSEERRYKDLVPYYIT